MLGATYNPAFARFLALHGLELRRELRGATPGVGVWYAGSRMGRFGPPAPEMEPVIASLGAVPPALLAQEGKRPRGRPRKTPPAEAKEKRPRGRPRKTPKPDEAAVAVEKRPRGRPRKTPPPADGGEATPSSRPQKPEDPISEPVSE